MSKINKRIIEYKNNIEVISFILEDGTKISNSTAIRDIQLGKIYNAKVISTNELQKVISKTGRIPTERVYSKNSKNKNSAISLPILELKDNDYPTSDIHLERTLYKDLLKWKEKGTRALFLTGPRQVGKTYLLEQFGKKEFKKYIYVNLSKKEQLGKFMSIYNRVLSLNKFGSSPNDVRLFWLNVFTLYDSNFVDSLDTLIFIDEIQDVPEVYNSIRELNRSLYSKVCFSGSYIGITQYKSEYNDFAGDFENLELQSLSYVEFLHAVGIYQDFLKVQEIDKNNLAVSELKIYSQVEEYYNVYCTIGGYPTVVKDYIKTKDIESCLGIVGDLLDDFYSESSRYLSSILENVLWSRTLTLVAQDIVSKSNNLKANPSGYLRENSEEMTIKRKDKNFFLGWLESSHIIGSCGIYTSFSPMRESADVRYYFNDMGILTYICRSNPTFIDSDIKGITAENFVYLYLNTNLCKVGRRMGICKDTVLHSYQGMEGNTKLEVDFILHSYNNERIGVEVKYHTGGVKSSDIALSKGYIKSIIKLTSSFGGVNENKTVIPIFGITKMKNYPPLLKKFSL